jgi:hypothetical protein
MLNNLKIYLDFLKHPNVKVPYTCFAQNYLLRLYFGSITARAKILSLIGLNFMLNKKKILLEFLKHPNVEVPYKCFDQNDLFRL